MAFAHPEYSTHEVNRAGKIMCTPDKYSPDEIREAERIFSNWRACHAYPINTFQATLRNKLKHVDNRAIVAQRLKRAPSIIAKLHRFSTMRLTQMQDIGGLRAVVNSVKSLRMLEKIYDETPFKHERGKGKDYLEEPKEDGYRGIHLIYKYNNALAPQYEGLSIELQFRTKLQHAWATAVETMGTFLGQALKSGQGDHEWKTFFIQASAAFAIKEGTPPVPGYKDCTKEEISRIVADSESRLGVLRKLKSFAVVADKITTSSQGMYNLLELRSDTRSVIIRRFPKTMLETASNEYAKIEKRAENGEPVEAVLVAAGPIAELKKAYPNYFLDTNEFLNEINKIIKSSK